MVTDIVTVVIEIKVYHLVNYLHHLKKDSRHGLNHNQLFLRWYFCISILEHT